MGRSPGAQPAPIPRDRPRQGVRFHVATGVHFLVAISIALVCLHGGVFFRFAVPRLPGPVASGAGPPLRAAVRQGGGRGALEHVRREAGVGSCTAYRELGVEHLRPRRDVTPGVALRRLLASTT